MKEAVLTITSQDGFHMRPASELVKVTSRFHSRITVERDGLEVDGKSILGVLMLAAGQSPDIHVRAEGVDEDEAIEAVKKLLEDKFGEE
jgi:phosphocarrier protein